MSLAELALSADTLRSSTTAMQAAVRDVTGDGAETWTGPLPTLLDALHQVARVDLCLARLVEGHADALRILEQAGQTPRSGVYGVWASRSAGTGVKAAPTEGGCRLAGELRFASGIDIIDRALLPGWLDEDHHVLLDVAATIAGPDRDSWRTSAMDGSRSFTVRLDAEAAMEDQVGPVNFYLDRPGFVVGGLCVASVWAGGAQSVVDLVTHGLRSFSPSTHQIRRVGVMAQSAWQARTAVRASAERLGESHMVSLARTAVVTACQQVLDEAVRVVGPGGLSTNARLARTIDDLTIYIGQHHLDAELERLGRHALTTHDVIG